MARLRSFTTLVWLVFRSFAIPLSDDGDDDDDCWLPMAPSPALLAPYETTSTSPSQRVHTSAAPAILGAVLGIMIALACALAACYLVRRRRGHPPRTEFREKRLSDESWVSPELPALGSPGSPLSQDVHLRQYAFPQRKPTSVTTPTDPEFEFEIPSVRVPAPAYISPFSPSPSMSSSPSSLSPTPSIDPFPQPNPSRLSRLLSCTFRGTSNVDSPARPTTARLIQTARSYAHAYRPSSTTSASLYTQPSVRFTGTRSRTSFYDPAWDRARDTISTVTTSDTICNVPHLLHAIGEDPSGEHARGTVLGLKVRLSDASEHARYRLRERERERRRQFERDLAESTRKEFRLSSVISHKQRG